MTIWHDGSEHQGVPIDDSYPHRVYCFRTNSGNTVDKMVYENGRRARSMLDRGLLDIVIGYYFFRPGQANCDLHMRLMNEVGLGQHPAAATMVDVEDDKGAIKGDQSAEVNDEVAVLRRYWGNNAGRVIGYLNVGSNAGLWRTWPVGMRFVTPQYGRAPGDYVPPATQAGTAMRAMMFAHQFTDAGRCAPFPRGVDLNYTALDIPSLKHLLGMDDDLMANATPEQVKIIEGGAKQLYASVAGIRPAIDALLPFLPDSFSEWENYADPKKRKRLGPSAHPWPNDMWTALVSELVTGTFTASGELPELPGVALVDVPADHATNFIGMIRVMAAKQDRVLELLTAKAPK